MKYGLFSVNDVAQKKPASNIALTLPAILMETRNSFSATILQFTMEARGVKLRLEASALSGLTRFVGRAEEMETLHDAIDKARSGAGQVGIVGEPGVVKSRIIL